MKRIIFVVFLLIFSLFSLTASAAGPTYNWTGFYVGLQGSYGNGDTDWEYLSNQNTADHNIDGLMIGLFAGYNYQFPFNLVVGIETDINGGKIAGSGPCPNSSWSCSSEISWAGSTRARVGYAIYRFLPYVAAGVAYGRAEILTTPNSSGVEYGEKKIYVGWTPSIGLEYAITDNILARLEYTYTDLGEKESTVDNGLLVDSAIKFHAFKLGLSWKF